MLKIFLILIISLSTVFSSIPDPSTDVSDPRENITAQYNTCDFDLVQTLNDPSLVEEFSEQCQDAYQNPKLRTLLLQESQLFHQINDKLLAYERQQDPECDPFEEGREVPCPTMDFEVRYEMYNGTDIMICQNTTEHYEFVECMIEKRNEMLTYLEGIVTDT